MSDLGVLFVNLLRYVPNFTVNTSLKLLPFRKKLPNEGKQFIVNGLNPNQVIWFTETPDRKVTDPVVVFLHGGGYFIGLSPFFMIFLSKFFKAVNDPKLSILILDYTLSINPDGKFPKQLDELTKTYIELQKTCTNINLLGDSAGGHLVLNFIRHHNYISETEKIPQIKRENFNLPNKIILISPWLNPTLDYRCENIDKFTHYFSIGALRQFQLYHQRPLIHYSIDESFIKCLRSTLVIYGSNEAMRGDIEEFIEINQRTNIRLKSRMIKRGIHDSGIVWPFGKNIVAKISGKWFNEDHEYV